MFVVLFAVGLLVAAAGFVTIGFGIPINAFSLGNTLIIAGSVGVVGGLALIGLAAAVRQLSRIAEALHHGRAAARLAPAPEASDSLVPPTAARAAAPVPPRPVVPPKPAEMPRPQEPRHAAEHRASGPVADMPAPLDWLRSKPGTPSASDKMTGGVPPEPVMEVPDEAPLSPRTPQRPLFSPPMSNPTAHEPQAEPRTWSPSRSPSEAMPKESRPDPLSRSEQISRMPAPPMDRAKEFGRETGRDAGKPATKDSGLFDVVWPDARAKPMTSSEPAKREPEAAPQRREESRSVKREDLPPGERPVAILKSGVIDGMDYTLYAYCSIEAELPQGTVKFASVDALRAHLEKSV